MGDKDSYTESSLLFSPLYIMLANNMFFNMAFELLCVYFSVTGSNSEGQADCNVIVIEVIVGSA